MGIKDLSKVIGDHAENAIRQDDIKAFFGRKVAVDASMSLYQFLIAVRQDGAQLFNSNGETTSHLNGIFYRSIRMLENGIKPAYVFDGAPPDLKQAELEKRTERRAEAQKELDKAVEQGDSKAIEKFERRLVKVTKEQNEQVKKLLRAMGIPVVEAPGEAEAQCAELVRKKKVFATATEDMDALTFGSTVLLRHLTFSEAQKVPIKEYSLEKILKGFEMSMEQFIDMCILLGCDYCDTIRGIGPKKAFELITKHKSIENILENLDTQKYPLPENFNYVAARKLFLEPNVTDGDTLELNWAEPNEEEIMKIMVEENAFNEDRIRNAITRLRKTRQTSQQGRIDSFFKSMGTVTTAPSAAKKRKAEEAAKSKKKGGAAKRTKR